MSDQAGKILAGLSTISTGLLAWIGCMATSQRDALDESVKASQLLLSQQSEERQRLAGQRDVNLKVYEAVVGAIEDSSRRRQELARSLGRSSADDPHPDSEVSGEAHSPRLAASRSSRSTRSHHVAAAGDHNALEGTRH